MERFTLHSERLLLDTPTVADIDDIERYCQDPIFERYMNVPWPYSRADAEFFVNEFVPQGWSSGEELTWALRLREGGPLLGVICLRAPSTDIGYWLGDEHRGNGYMPEAVTFVIGWAFDNRFVGAQALNWEAVAGNAPSASVARKSGFTFTGEAPSRLEYRDGTRPLSWHGVLRADDERQPKAGWPA